MCINPISLFVKDLQASDWILREEGEEANGTFMRANSLRAGSNRRIVDELQARHNSHGALKGTRWQRQGLSDRP